MLDKTLLLSELENLAAAHDLDPYEFGAALAAELRDAVIRKTDSADAYVALDLDSGDLKLEAIAADGESTPISLEDLGRRGAGAIKEAFDRTIAAAASDRLEELLAENSGQVVSGHITQSSDQAAIVSLPNGVDGELLASAAPGVQFRQGMTVSAVLTGEVDSSGGTPRAQLSRRPDSFVLQLLSEAVPSIADGSIEVKHLVREPGVRTKILVEAVNTSADPVALIIGSGGATIRKVADQLHPERLDVIGSDDLPAMVSAALSPGKVYQVTTEDDKVVAWVKPDDRPAAFGRNGTNVRLASQLLGVRVDIRSPGEDDPADVPVEEAPAAEGEPAGNEDLPSEDSGAEGISEVSEPAGS